jgi:membrane fusion protein, copper/silver efflux system
MKYKKISWILIIFLASGIFLAGRLSNRKPINKPIILKQTVQKEESISGESAEDLSLMPSGAVRISPERQQAIGIRIGSVEKKPITQIFRLLGRVAPDETGIYFINATVDGWITEVLPKTTGSYVKKNETLAKFYSPEFLSAEQALLFALGSKDRIQTTDNLNPAQKGQLEQFNINLQQYRDSLKNLGMGDLQIEEMIRTRKYTGKVNITSPSDGFVLSRNVSQGLRFDKGRELFRIADLSRVWIVVDVFENQADYFKTGVEAKIRLANRGKIFKARVTKVLPIFDPGSRTLKLRLEADNPSFVLRPDMFVDVELPLNLPPTITVPSDAVLDSGLKKTVFVDLGKGYFEPREVETGWRLGNQVEITKGLSPGERIVTSGTFLIDSESRMELAVSGMAAGLCKDPVTGQDVSIRKAEKMGKKSTFQGKTYYFASDDSKGQFEANPTKYSEKAVGGSSHSECPDHTGHSSKK